MGDLGETPLSATACENRDDVDGLGDQGTRNGEHGFLHKLLKPAQCTDRGVGVDGADPARMAGAPGFEQIERLAAAHLANRNPIGPQAQRRLHQIGQ